MATKDNPGEFDCYARAAPDEPMFVLLARDPVAPLLVYFWAELRLAMERCDAGQAEEARTCAEAMRVWASAQGKRALDPDDIPQVKDWLSVALGRTFGVPAHTLQLAIDVASRSAIYSSRSTDKVDAVDDAGACTADARCVLPANHDELTAQYSTGAAAPELASLKSKLDEVWGIDNLVDINVEEPGDYLLVLEELVALARRTQTEKT